MVSVALTIAGSDPSGGAGLQADLKTFHQFGVYGCSAVTLLTVQNTVGVTRVESVAPELIAAQIESVCTDLEPKAAKSGALGTAAAIEQVAELASKFTFPLVVDPVMISKHGHPLIDAAAVDALRERLLPHAFLLTPNTLEAEQLVGQPLNDLESVEVAAKQLQALGCRNVLIKGPRIEDGRCDLLLTETNEVHRFTAAHQENSNTHGSGCVYSAAITASLATGIALRESIERSKSFITEAIAHGPRLGEGIGPVNMHQWIDVS